MKTDSVRKEYDMRTINGSDPVFDKLVTGKDKYLFNLLYRIREDSGSCLVTDDSTCIIARSNPNTPVWIWLKHAPVPPVRQEIAAYLCQCLDESGCVNISSCPPYSEELLKEIAAQNHGEYRVNKLLNSYACHSVRHVKTCGRILIPDPSLKEAMARLITVMYLDAGLGELSREEALGFAEEKSVSDSLFLWENEQGEVVSMVNIAHRTQEYARLNAVVTDRSHRGRGYGAMLVSEVSQRLLQAGQIPVLYADAGYPPSNALYRKTGYVQQGQVAEQCIIRR